jgi:prevent-host-death family protein
MVPPTLPLAEAKNRFSEVVDEVERKHGRVVITKHGRPVAVLMNIEDLESLEETLDVMSDPELMAAIAEAEADIAAGRGIEMSKEEALELVRRSR